MTRVLNRYIPEGSVDEEQLRKVADASVSVFERVNVIGEVSELGNGRGQIAKDAMVDLRNAIAGTDSNFLINEAADAVDLLDQANTGKAIEALGEHGVELMKEVNKLRAVLNAKVKITILTQDQIDR